MRISAIDRRAAGAIVGVAAGPGKVAVRQPVTRATLKNASNNRDSTVLTEICLFTAERSMGLQWAGNKLD